MYVRYLDPMNLNFPCIHGLQGYEGRDNARLRAPGERAFALLKSWRILRRARCSTPTSAAPSRPSTHSSPATIQDERGSVSRFRESARLWEACRPSG